MNKLIYKIKKGYHKPVTMARWKWAIIWLLMFLGFIFYVAAMIFHPLWIILGIFFQTFGMTTQSKWDTGNWRDTQVGKDYFEKYSE